MFKIKLNSNTNYETTMFTIDTVLWNGELFNNFYKKPADDTVTIRVWNSDFAVTVKRGVKVAFEAPLNAVFVISYDVIENGSIRRLNHLVIADVLDYKVKTSKDTAHYNTNEIDEAAYNIVRLNGMRP